MFIQCVEVVEMFGSQVEQADTIYITNFHCFRSVVMTMVGVKYS